MIYSPARRKFDPWFPTHPERDLYISLLQSGSSVPENVLKAALLRRAAADVARILRIREDKQALQILVQKGSVGDDLWNSCLAAEKELEAEILEVMGEANTFRQGWGQIIFASASEIMNHDKILSVLSSMPQIRSEAGMLLSNPSTVIHYITKPIRGEILAQKNSSHCSVNDLGLNCASNFRLNLTINGKFIKKYDRYASFTKWNKYHE